MIRCLNWLAIISRPDITYIASRLAKFNTNPPDDAIKAAKHVYRYLRGTIGLGVVFSPAADLSQLIGHTDSNWGDNTSNLDKKSTTGYCFTIAGGPISWISQKQRTTATSTTEAEYIAQCSVTKEAVYLR